MVRSEWVKLDPHQFLLGNKLHQHLGAKFNCVSLNRLFIVQIENLLEPWMIGLDYFSTEPRRRQIRN